MESWYRRFKADISTDELEKFTATTHTELNRTYEGGGDNDDDGTRRFQEMCLLIPANSERFSGLCSGINNNAPLGIDHGQ